MSKFVLSQSAKAPSEQPITHEKFVGGAALVKSQGSHRPEKPVRLNLDLDPALHQKLKMRAVETHTTVAALVRDLICKELE